MQFRLARVAGVNQWDRHNMFVVLTNLSHLFFVAALCKLRLYKHASDEVTALGDLDDPKYTYEHYPAL